MNVSIRKRLLAMKISNWESIPYSVGLQCPNGDDGSLMEGKSKVIGWCDTPKGLMKVCECQVCFSKFRYHGFHGSLEAFLNSLEEDIVYQEQGLETWSELTLKRFKHEI